ncbi:MAG TPA: mandelate racemase/muconate lactonizing enzyme family protein [Chloroflexota bacterium]
MIETARSAAPITRIETIAVRVPLDRVYRGSYYSMRNRCTIITRVYTTDGAMGESYNGDADEEQAQVLSIIGDEITPLLQGTDAWQVECCWQQMLPVTYNILRDRTLALQAMACVDSAIWDLIGKMMGQPLSRVWGAYADALPLIVIGGYYSDDPSAIDREAERYREMGVGGCKFKVGGRSPEEDAERTRRLRAAVGPDFIITVDANQGYRLRDAIRFAELTRGYDLVWFEEPCGWMHDRTSMRDVRMITGVPTCAGQSETTPNGIKELMLTGSIDVCNFDASWSGGPSQWRRIAGMASVFGVRMAHHEEPQISAQLLASTHVGTFVETFLPERDPIFWNMIANRPALEGGMYPIPPGPGWGLTLDEDWIAKYRADAN